MKDRRFVEKLDDGFAIGSVRILVDSETGVNYMATNGGLTPLLDKDGKVVVSTGDEVTELKASKAK